MRKINLLVDASNLHVGGGVAVATSFINQLSIDPDGQIEYTLLISTIVYRNLVAMNSDLHKFKNVYLKDCVGFLTIFCRLPVSLKKFDVVFSVFGPIYRFHINSKTIVGVADPHFIYTNYCQLQNFSSCLYRKIKYAFQTFFLRRVSAIIVELPSIKEILLQRKELAGIPIHVVSSAPDDVFFAPQLWKSFDLVPRRMPNVLNLGVISKNYPHKNLSIFAEVKRHLFEKYSMETRFYVTFSKREWDLLDSSFKGAVVNVGPLSLNQCPLFYSSLDAVVFPTLLESFSSVPLETFLQKKPLFVSDRPFIRDVCQDYAKYIDPQSAISIADSIFEYFQQPSELKKTWVESAYKFACSRPTAVDRANSYLSIIKSMIGVNCD